MDRSTGRSGRTARPGRRAGRKGSPVAVGQALSKVLSELGLEGAQRAFEIGECWERAVGAEVAKHSRPRAMRGDVLEVVVDSSVWAQQLQLELPRVLAALAEALPEGEAPPRRLRFRVGTLR